MAVIDQFNKIEGISKSRKVRKLDSFDFVHKQLKYLGELIDSDNELGPTLNNVLHKQYLASLVTLLEVYYRERFIELFEVDGLSITPFHDKNIGKFTLSDLSIIYEKMKDEDFTFSDIIASWYNFQNLNSINAAYNKALGKMLFKELAFFEMEDSDGDLFYMGENVYRDIQRILDDRHSVVHDINYSKKISKYRIEKYFDKIHLLIDLSHILIDELVISVKGLDEHQIEAFLNNK